MPKKFLQVRYEWRQPNGERREGRTVVSALSQDEAEARFQRQNRHVSVIPAALTAEPQTTRTP